MSIVSFVDVEGVVTHIGNSEILGVYRTTEELNSVVLVGEESGLFAARQAIEMLAGGSEHGTVLGYLERDRKRARLDSKSLDAHQERATEAKPSAAFDALVPGLAEVSQRRNRRMKASQVDPEDEEAVSEMMVLSDDEQIHWEEE